MNKTIILILAVVIVSSLLVAASPAIKFPNQDPDKNPWPKELNRGEPTMEKIYFDGWIDHYFISGFK